ncbi:MAG: alpha-glucosidase [Hyphomonadaceae bacterium]|nr:alpha-glucosidase [Hyphomonadaceae bacterium]
MTPPPRADWWKRAVVYQIYPKSFRDVTGDGVGDIRGITDRLPYLADLGVSVLWLSPIFASPMIDNGYDTSDYTTVNPLFGTMDDADELIAEAAKRGIRIVLDIALNHTSTDHPWFQNALTGGDKRDWYWFRDGRCGAAPNNWRSIFGGPAWSRSDTHGTCVSPEQYYLHLFDKSQADLNWENPAVRAAIHDAMRFWLDRGVGGFRLDVVTVISKEPDLRDVADPRPGPLYRHIAGGPRLHEFLREMRREVFAHYDCVAIGEAPGVDPARAAKLVDPADPMLDMIYHFDLVEPKRDAAGAWDRAAFKRVFSAWDGGIGPRGWNSVVLSNHDLARIVSRFGDDGAGWRESSTLLMALVLTQRGTPFVYQGDELGMKNCPFAAYEDLDDVWAKTTYRLNREAGAGHDAAFAAALAMTRDHARTPFQWDAGLHAGFSTATPWLTVNPDHATLNAAAQADDPSSPLAFTQRLIAMRTADPLWIFGAFEDAAPDHPDVFHFTRTFEGRRAHVVLNLRGRTTPYGVPDEPLLLCNHGGPAPADSLRPWEARITAPAPAS